MITAPHELTPAQWQVLGAVLDGPLPVSEIARRIGLTRQSVQRVANDVAGRGWAEWSDNPRHRRAKLLVPTERGREAIGAIVVEQQEWADAVGARFTAEDLRALTELAGRVVAASRAYRNATRTGPPSGPGADPGPAAARSGA
ncbi:MarR family transcriptional regulator [Myceligenerans sp. I2]|uniref:MarR family transcriptional regulator n=2 Tax=Myceligenerans indicum TaxID=2593663 RepID=A0ABS1LNX3_9MICO|nr:MarR family transcriptional regulator [Myceligenerans indicum]